ncbi:hypothetical protein ABIE09_003236 [Lysobacter enzymogenes]
MRARGCGPSPQPLSRKRERGFGDIAALRRLEAVIPAKAGIQGFTDA